MKMTVTVELSTYRVPLHPHLILTVVSWDRHTLNVQKKGWGSQRLNNLTNVRYANDTTLMAESEEELKSLLMKVKEETEQVGLKLNV